MPTMAAETSGPSPGSLATVSPRNPRRASSVTRSSASEPTPMYAPAAMDSAPATPTVKPPAAGAERGDVLQAEGLLPERHVASLDGDQLVERVPEPPAREAAQRAIEREIEDLVENEAPAEPRVRAYRHSSPSRRGTSSDR